MYCSKCGAAVVGKYCSCCGAKIRPAAAELRLASNAERRRFKERHREIDSPWEFWLAEACWDVARIKYDVGCGCNGQNLSNAIENLKVVTEHAEKLFEQLVNF